MKETLEQTFNKLEKTALKVKRDRDALLAACIAVRGKLTEAMEQVNDAIEQAMGDE